MVTGLECGLGLKTWSIGIFSVLASTGIHPDAGFTVLQGCGDHPGANISRTGLVLYGPETYMGQDGSKVGLNPLSVMAGLA